MLNRSAWLHLRIPFSYFLIPIFLFSLSISPNLSPDRLLWTFVIIHLFLYPASNGFNSYFDKDEKSIGGLKNPPPVNKTLYFLALIFDVIALILGLIFLDLTFTLMLLGYGLVSKAYSHPKIRLKKYPFIGWLTTSFFQGFYTVIMCYVGINGYALEDTFSHLVIGAGLLASLMLMANYPMTQVYQHEEDRKRGDITLSLILGIKGTFIFVGLFFILTTVGFLWYFYHYFDLYYAYVFVVALAPVILFFGIWSYSVFKDTSKANYKYTMRLNYVSATCLSAFFLYFFFNHTHILDAFN